MVSELIENAGAISRDGAIVNTEFNCVVLERKGGYQ